MKYKMIATDFDSTLLNSNKEVSDKTRDILLKFKNKGYYIVGVTARNLSSAKSVCDINMFNYLILNNGGFIYDVLNKKDISINNINIDTINGIFSKYKDNSNGITFCSLDKYYIYSNNISCIRDFEININNIYDIDDNINKINIFVDDKDIDICLEYLKRFRDINSIIMQDTDGDNRRWITINNDGLNKYTTLEYLCNKLNMSTDQVIFFGDSSNDIEIINGVGLGVAMGNALSIVKDAAKEVTLSNDEDGIYVFLKNNIEKD